MCCTATSSALKGAQWMYYYYYYEYKPCKNYNTGQNMQFQVQIWHSQATSVYLAAIQSKLARVQRTEVWSCMKITLTVKSDPAIPESRKLDSVKLPGRQLSKFLTVRKYLPSKLSWLVQNKVLGPKSGKEVCWVMICVSLVIMGTETNLNIFFWLLILNQGTNKNIQIHTLHIPNPFQWHEYAFWCNRKDNKSN